MKNTIRWITIVFVSGFLCASAMAAKDQAAAHHDKPAATATVSHRPAAPSPRPFATSAPADTATTQPSANLMGRDLPELLPSGTVLYMGWPGIAELATSMSDTNLAKLLAEPEVVKFRQEFLPAMDRFIRGQLDTDEEMQAYSLASGLLQELWNHPTILSLTGISLGEAGPAFDAALIIRAGHDTDRIQQSIEEVFKALNLPPQAMTTVEINGTTWQEINLLGPAMPIRWGTVDQHVILAIGTKITEHLTATETANSLGQEQEFMAAMKASAATAGHPTLYLNIHGVLEIIKTFEPMLAMFQVPVLGQSGTVQRWMDSLGLGEARSLSVVGKGHANGWQTDIFLHVPGLGQNPDARFSRKPITDADLACVPQDVNIGYLSRIDLLRKYTDTLALLEQLLPLLDHGKGSSLTEAVAAFEKEHNINIVNDLIEPFGDNWIVYDAPAAGGLWFAGLTAVATVDQPDRLHEGLRQLVKAIAAEANAEDSVSFGEETYRGQKITFVNVVGVPMPIAPAWAQVDDHWVFGFFPQMVRLGVDQLLDKKTSLLDNPDFQRARQLLPENASCIEYSDTAAGMRDLYSILLPISQILLAMGQQEGLTLDISVLPSLPTINRHLFGQINGAAASDEGWLARSHGPLPLPVASVGSGTAAVPIMMSILLPSLSRARHLAKRAASAANLKGIGPAMFTYANEHDDTYPPDLETLVREGLIGRKSLISPLAPENKTSYIYIPGQTTDASEKNILVYEDPANDDEGGNALFADGHVEWLDAEQLQETIEQTRQRIADQESPSPDSDSDTPEENETEQELEESGNDEAVPLPTGQL